jgi:hypothetical protein
MIEFIDTIIEYQALDLEVVSLELEVQKVDIVVTIKPVDIISLNLSVIDLI